MYKFSIIIPMYNVQNTLHNSLDSLVNQNFKDFELILIDDGSTDNTKLVVKQYQNIIKNMRYFYKENGGVSSARNYGLNKVNGEYVLFLDADDFYENDTLKTLSKCIDNYDIEILCFSAKKINKDYGYMETITHINQNKKYVIDKNETIKNFLNYKLTNKILSLVSNKLYKYDIIKNNNILFCEDMLIGEDFIFNLEYYCCVKSMYEIKDELYNYYQSDNSLMRTNYFEKNIINVQKYIQVLKDVFIKHSINLSTDYIDLFYLSKFFGVVANESKCKKFSVGFNNVKSYCKLVNRNLSIKEMTKKEQIYYIIIKLKLSYILYIIMYIKHLKG